MEYGPTELPVWPQGQDGWTEAPTGQPMDLNMLWKVLEKHKEVMKEKEEAGQNISTTWELVVVQGIILTVLILISVMWAFCCRKRCYSADITTVSVAEALRKLSRDLPPSYSTRDLHTLGVSVADHLHPPPAYLELFNDNLQYLDLEGGHTRMAKLSFCDGSGGPPRLARLSVASCASCSNDSAVVVPVARQERQESRFSVTSSSSGDSSRKSSSSNSTSGRASRVSFSEDVAFSNGSVRRLSSANRLNGIVIGPSSSSRKSSSSSEGSRKSSLISSVKRKFGSQSSVHNDTFASQLDDELRSKLERIGEPDPKIEPEPEKNSPERIATSQEEEEIQVVVEPREQEERSRREQEERSRREQEERAVISPERQAERAARVCDIIHEEKH